MAFAFLLIALPGAALGVYLIVRPEAYKDEMAGLGHLFGTFPVRSIRILGLFLLVFVAGMSYMFFLQPR